MKAFVAAMIMLAVLLGGGVLYGDTVHRITAGMLECSNEINIAIEEENYDKIQQSVDRLNMMWEEKHPLLSALVDHADLMDVSSALSQMQVYIKSGNYANANAQNAYVIEGLKEISSSDNLSLENLL